MSMTEPIPDLQWGKGDWQDYINNWREKDAEWMQARGILRYHNATDRQLDLGTPGFGQTTYNEMTDKLEMFSKLAGDWAQIFSVRYLTVTQDSTAGVALSHINSGGRGIIFQPTVTVFDNPVSMMNVATADATGLSVKTGSGIKSTMSTDATSMVFSTPITAPGLNLTGGGVIINAPGRVINVGTINADTGNFTNINLTGTLTGGVINGTSGTIGGVTLGVIGHSHVGASYHVSNAGVFYGDSGSAIFRYRNPSGGGLGNAYMQVGPDNSVINGAGVLDIYQQVRIRAKSVQYLDPAGTLRANCGGVVYSGGDPGAANYAEGTLWVS